MDPNAPAVQPASPQQPSPLPPTENKSRMKIMIAVGVAVFVVAVIGVVGVLLLNGNKVAPSPYIFSINEQTVPQQDVQEIYTYYKNQPDIDFKRDITLANISNMYVENYLLKKEYASKGRSAEALDTTVRQVQNTINLVGAPSVLISVTAENSALRQLLFQDIGVNTRSGYLFSIRVTEQVSSSSATTLAQLAQQRLQIYQAQATAKVSFDEIKNSFTKDTQLLAQKNFALSSSYFEGMNPLHLPLPGDAFKSSVFDTAQNTVSSIFVSGSDEYPVYGFVYPTTPKPVSAVDDIREWLAQQKKSVNVTTDFSGIN